METEGEAVLPIGLTLESLFSRKPAELMRKATGEPTQARTKNNV
jgi:hypothetical protein